MKNTTRPVGKGSTPPAVAYLHKSDKAIAMVPLRGTKAEEEFHGYRRLRRWVGDFQFFEFFDQGGAVEAQ